MMRLGFEEFERETMFGRIKKGLLIVWDVLFPPLEGDPESDDEIMVQPVVRDILDRQDSIPME
jgi:hypothetical protein